MRLRDKVAVVTGGASGIGAATCERMREEGANAISFDCAPGAAYTLDVRDEVAVAAAFQDIQAQFGRVDILVNNAGVALRQPVHEATVENWAAVMDVNVKGAFLCSKYAIPLMAAGSSITHVSSVTGITGVRGRAAYSSAKGALVGLMRNMALDYAGRGIRVNCVCPGFVRTPFIGAITSDAARSERLRAMHPLGRLGFPRDIANAIVFLSGDEASWITGHALVVDGGFSVGQASEI